MSSNNNLIDDGTNEEVNSCLSSVEIQQHYFENLDDCDWVKYEKQNRKFLLQNIAFALFGSPSEEGDLLTDGNKELVGYESRQKYHVLNVYQKICDQSKYSKNDEDILMSIILVVCAKPKPLPFFQISPSDYWVDLHTKNDVNIWCTAVFRVRKCVPTTNAKCCKVFIDDNARVYNDWDSYLRNNTLPKCVIVAPTNGEYKGMLTQENKSFLVKLTVAPSPALGLSARVLSSVDTVSTVASVGALGVLGVAAFTPVGPVVLAGAAVATAGTAIYGLVRSSYHLYDRSAHQQSISITESEARNCWINITASSIGIAAGAASTMLAKSAAVGTNLTKVGKALVVSVEFLRHANLVTGGIGVLNSLVHIIVKYNKYGEKPTKLEMFQLSAATLFFFQGAMSNRTAQDIVNDAQAKTINEYRASLRSNRHRKMFDKVSAESRRVQGSVLGNTEVIKGIKNINNKDQFFSDILRINKDVNQHKLRISMSADGQVNLNQAHKFDPANLSALGKDGRAELFSNIPASSVKSPNVPTKLTSSSVNTIRVEEDDKFTFVGIRPEEVLRVGIHIINITRAGAESIASLLENLSEEAHAIFMTIVFNIISILIPKEIACLKLLSPDEDLITQVVNFVFYYLKHERPLGTPCPNNSSSIIILLSEFFQDGRIKKETILRLKLRLLQWIDTEFDKYRSQFPNKNPIICDACSGVRFA